MKDLKEAEVARNRKQPPKLVEWAQERILQKLLQFLSQGAQFSHGTSVKTDTKAVAVNDVRNEEIINAIRTNTEVLERIVYQLSIITDVDLKPGDTI